MTRLITQDIQNIPAGLPAYESSLISRTGCSLRQLSCLAMGITENDVQTSLNRAVIGVIPMTAGHGRLKGFSRAVSEIIRHIGGSAFVTRKTDTAGIAEAVERNANILIFADDDRFVALNIQSRKLVDNADATGRGFVAGLHLMAGHLKGRKVIVLGCGLVGQSAVKALVKAGSRVSVYDNDPAAFSSLSSELVADPGISVQLLTDLEPALRSHELIFDASPASALISARHITPNTIVSAPGIPLGLGREALSAIGDRLLHDPLQIGVATMIVDVLAL